MLGLQKHQENLVIPCPEYQQYNEYTQLYRLPVQFIGMFCVLDLKYLILIRWSTRNICVIMPPILTVSSRKVIIVLVFFTIWQVYIRFVGEWIVLISQLVSCHEIILKINLKQVIDSLYYLLTNGGTLQNTDN